jgi:hypothetical protein
MKFIIVRGLVVKYGTFGQAHVSFELKVSENTSSRPYIIVVRQGFFNRDDLESAKSQIYIPTHFRKSLRSAGISIKTIFSDIFRTNLKLTFLRYGFVAAVLPANG